MKSKLKHCLWTQYTLAFLLDMSRTTWKACAFVHNTAEVCRGTKLKYRCYLSPSRHTSIHVCTYSLLLFIYLSFANPAAGCQIQIK